MDALRSTIGSVFRARTHTPIAEDMARKVEEIETPSKRQKITHAKRESVPDTSDGAVPLSGDVEQSTEKKSATSAKTNKSKGAATTSESSKSTSRKSVSAKKETTWDWSMAPLDFQFSVEYRKAAKRKRKRADELDHEDPYQQGMDVTYAIKPASVWAAMTPYRKFTVTEDNFKLGDNIFIKAEGGREDSERDWIGRVMEVRAGDPQHVYVRILWFCHPEDVPGGRQPWHGQRELIASNWMEIVDALTVDGRADVVPYSEEEELPDSQFYWRQTMDYQKSKNQLSDLPKYGELQQPVNPEKDFHCTNADCKAWNHREILLKEAVEEACKANGIPHEADNATTTPPAKKKRAPQKSGKKARKSLNGDSTELDGTTLVSFDEAPFTAEFNDDESKIIITDARPETKGEKKEQDVFCMHCKTKID